MSTDQHGRGELRQLVIDYDRGTQLAMLRDAELPALRGVSAVTAKAVLRIIDDHARRAGECWATQETIRQQIGARSIKTVKRAIAALVDLSLITCDRRSLHRGRMSCNHYKIVWSELALLSNPRSNARAVPDRERLPEMAAIGENIKGTFTPDQRDIYARSKGHYGPFVGSESKRERTATAEAAAADDFSKNLFRQEQHGMASRKRLIQRPILEQQESQEKAQRAGESKSDPLPGRLERDLVDLPGDWSAYEQQRFEDVFAAIGLGGPRSLVRAAIARGLSPEMLDGLLDQWRGCVDAKDKKPLGAPAIKWRIEQGNWPCNLISKKDLESAPAPDAADVVREKARAARAAEDQRARERARADREREAARERKLGPVLDAMPEHELQQLIERLPDWCKTGIAAHYIAQRPIKFGLIRFELLGLLQQQQGE
jgi:hypothetical protein